MKARTLVLTAIGAVSGAAAVAYAQASGRLGVTAPAGPRTVTSAVTINRPVTDLYAFWRDLTNLPRLTRHLESVEILDKRRSRWRALGPGGSPVAWEAETTEDRPNESIAWRSLGGSEIANQGRVTFHPATGLRGTVVEVSITYEPPAGAVGVVAATLAGEEPEQQLRDALRRFKQLMETGEISTTEDQPAGARTAFGFAGSGTSASTR